ncbi:MAG: Hpt domain-containing protein [Pseudomonadota bacterium]
MDDIRETFFDECEELLESVNAGLKALERGEGDGETLRTVHRAVHSMKGGAAAFDFDRLSDFAYAFEKALKEACEDRLSLDSESLDVFWRAGEALRPLVDAARSGQPAPTEDIDALTPALKAMRVAPPEEEALSKNFTPAKIDIDPSIALGTDEPRGFLIYFKPYPDLYDLGNEASSIIAALAELGELRVACDADALPGLDDIDPSNAYLSWTIRLKTRASTEEVMDMFEFVEGECALQISDWRERDDVDPTDQDCAAAGTTVADVVE